MPIGIPIGAPAIVIVSATPIAISVNANMAVSNLPAILRIQLNSPHTAANGHKTKGVFL